MEPMFYFSKKNLDMFIHLICHGDIQREIVMAQVFHSAIMDLIHQARF
jgi:hypothetical protein